MYEETKAKNKENMEASCKTQRKPGAKGKGEDTNPL